MVHRPGLLRRNGGLCFIDESVYVRLQGMLSVVLLYISDWSYLVSLSIACTIVDSLTESKCDRHASVSHSTIV